MTHKINDYITIALSFAKAEDSRGSADWVEFPAQFGNAINSVHMTAGSNIKMPTIAIEVTDLIRFFDAFATEKAPGLTDGALIKLVITDTQPKERFFRVYSWQRSPYGEGYQYSISGYWDSIKYWQGSRFNGIRGSSSAVLQEVASVCGLTWATGNTTTEDTMLWMPHNRSYGDFAKEVAAHGYKDSTSHMVLGIDSLGRMVYRNVNANPAPTVTLSYLRPEGTGDEQHHLIQDFFPKNRAGLYNSLGGYLHTRYVQSLDPALNVPIDTLNYADTLDSALALRNPIVSTNMINGVVSYSPVDVKNVGEFYQLGKYQNYNYNLFNMVMGEFLFAYVTQWEVCDNFKYFAPPEMLDKTYNGEYTVVSKTILIAGSSYNEKIVAVRTGLGEKE